MRGYELNLLDGEYAVWKLPPDAGIPSNVRGDLLSVTQTRDEMSVVSSVDSVPSDAEVEAGWTCLKVAGPLAFERTGVLASLSAPLAEAKIPIFVVSTFDTDYLLLPQKSFERARGVLEVAGHSVTG